MQQILVSIELYVQTLVAKGLWPGLRPLVSSTLTGTPLGYPVVALCHGDPAALGLWIGPLHVL